MKKTAVINLLFSLLFLSACSNEFEVAAPWQDIPVVYGLVNIDDNVHYIRVEKAFLDPDGDALVIAKNPDSLYYGESLVVQFEKVNTGQVFTLQRVDGTSEGLPRVEGIFATTPNYLYKIDDSVINLAADDSLVLKIDRGNGLPIVTGGARVQSKGVLKTPTLNTRSFDFYINNPKDIRWQSSTEAKIFDVVVTFNYAEFPQDNPSAVVTKSFEWIWANGLSFERAQDNYDVTKVSNEFFNVVKNNIPVDPNLKRVFIDMDVEIVSGGSALHDYIVVSLANGGITGSQERPTFTNLSEGVGVFSTIDFINEGEMKLSDRTRDTLSAGYLTKDLNFQR